MNRSSTVEPGKNQVRQTTADLGFFDSSAVATDEHERGNAGQRNDHQTGGVTLRNALGCLLPLTSFLIFDSAIAAQAESNKLTTPTDFDIPSQRLGSALELLADQAGIQILFEERLVRGRRAPAIKARQSPADTLQALLINTDLEFSVQDETVAVRRRTSARSSTAVVPKSAAAAAALLGLAVGAQAAEQAPQPSALEEVIVTAQRREEGLQRTPVAVTALSEEQLLERGIDTTQDLQQNTPNLQVATQTSGQGTASATFFIRGLGQQRGGNGTQPAVGVYVDDFYYPSLSGNLFRVLDVQGLEVLRGPQGTLFGRNTIGGAVRYITKRPSSEFEGYVDVTGGSREHFDAVAMVNVPVTDNFSLRASGGKLSQDGFVRRATDGGEDGASESSIGRVQARYQPADSLTIDFTAAYIEDQLEGFPQYIPRNIVGAWAGIWNAQNPGNPYDGRYVSNCFYCVPGSNFSPYAKSIYNAYQATISWDVAPGLTIKSLTGQNNVRTQSRGDWDASPLPIANQSGTGKTEAFSQELQFNGVGFDDRLNWVGGLYYFDSEDNTTGRRVGVTPSNSFSTGETTSYAAYVQASYAFTDKLALTGGIRYSREESFFRNTNTLSGSGSNEETWNDTSPLLKLQYQWTDTIMTYVSASRGFRGGGFNASFNPNLPNSGIIPFDPETVWSYEAGARLELLDRRLRVNPTVFYMDYTGLQLENLTPVGNTVALLIQNAGKSRVYGSELEFAALITNAFEIHGYVSTLDAAYKELGSASSLTLNSEFERAPSVSYAIGGSYEFDLSSGSSITASLDWAWTDEQQSSPNPQDSLTLPAFGLLNGRIQYNPMGGRWQLAVYGRNLADKEYFIGGTNYFFVGPATYDVGQPREIGANVRFNF